MARDPDDSRTANRALGDALGAPDHASDATLRLRSRAREEVRDALRGRTVAGAAEVLGVDVRSLFRWLARWPELRT